MNTNRLQLEIDGMSCGSCVAHVRTALARLPDVQVDDVQVGRAIITTAPAVKEESIRQTIADAGYALRDIRSGDADSAAAVSAGRAATDGCCCGGGHAGGSSAHVLKRRRVAHPQG